MPYMPFTPGEVRLILQLSEAADGHAGERHVNPGKDMLAKRVRDYKGTGLALRTAFLSFDDMIQALTAVLNDPANDAELRRFDAEAKQGDGGHFEIKNVALPRAFRMHYGIGDTARIFPCSMATLVLHKHNTRPRGMHVVTFFGTMGPMI